MSERTADADRGEHEVTLGGVTYVLRPSWAAIKAIEKKCGDTSLMVLFNRANAGNLTLEQIGIVGAELIRAGADADDTLTRKVSADRISQLAYEEGVGHVLARLVVCMLDGITGGRDASGEAKAVASAPTTDSATAD